jgi:drug/metabolite transporter (DMT)-like permease
MTSKSNSATNVLLMLCLTFFWGSAYVVAKEILRNGLTPIAIATFRFLLAGALFLPVLLLNRTRSRGYRLLIERKDVPVLLLLALTGVTFYFIVQYTGIEMAGASIASIMVSLLSPIVIGLFSAKVLKERLTKKQVLGIGIASIGTATVVAGTTLSLGNDANFLIGSLILLLTPFLWATYTIAGKRILEKYDAVLTVAYVNIFGALCLIPFSLAENSFQGILSLTVNEWLGVLYLGSVCSLLGYLIWFYVLKQISATVTSSFMFAQPLITVLLSAAFLNEDLTLPIVVGGFLIFIGVYLVGRKWTRLNFFV